MRIEPSSRYSWWVRPLLWLQKRHYGEILNPARLWGRKPVLFYLVAGFLAFRSQIFPLICGITLLGLCSRIATQ